MTVLIELNAMRAVKCDPVLVDRLIEPLSFASHAYVLQPKCPSVSSIPMFHVLVLASSCSVPLRQVLRPCKNTIKVWVAFPSNKRLLLALLDGRDWVITILRTFLFDAH